MIRRIQVSVVFLTILLTMPNALAYRAARIATDTVELKAQNNGESETVTTLSQGTRLNTSDVPIAGWYKVRSAKATGWIREEDLDFTETNDSKPPTSPKKPPKQRPREQLELESASQAPASRESAWNFRVFSGLDFWSPTDITNLVGSTSLQGGGGYGAQLNLSLSSSVSAAVRIEKLSKSSTGPFGSDTVTVQLESLPVTLGLEGTILHSRFLSWSIAAHAGAALSTSASETDTTQPTPNVTTLSTTALTALFSTNLNWQFSKPFWIYLEPGYRYLKTGQSIPSTQGSGTSGALFQVNGQYVPISINLSGAFVNLGLRINF